MRLIHAKPEQPQTNDLQCPYHKTFGGCNLFLDFAEYFLFETTRDETIPDFGRAVDGIIKNCPGSSAGVVSIAHGSVGDLTGVTSLSVSINQDLTKIELVDAAQVVPVQAS